MRKVAILVAVAVFGIFLSGCGVPKKDYEQVKGDKEILDIRLNSALKNLSTLKVEKDALAKEMGELKAEYENSLSQKNALKDEYNRLLDQTISLKASLDKADAAGKRTEPVTMSGQNL